jgi:hypothetical protein
VRAIVPSDDDEVAVPVRVWQYGVITGVLPGGELARVQFDDRSPVATLCVYDLQDAQTNRWI